MPRRYITPAFVLLAIGLSVLIYARAANYPLIYDDFIALKQNASIRQLWPISEPLTPPQDSPLSVRPLVNLSMAVNYSLGDLDPRGYRVVNLLLHVVTSLLLYGVLIAASLSVARKKLYSPVRWRGAMWVDLTAASCAVLADGLVLSPGFLVFLMVILGNGMRYGMRLFAEAVMPAAARNGAEPGAMFTPSFSIASAAAIIWSTMASEALSVLRFAKAIASSMSVRSRSIGCASAGWGIAP